MSAARACPQAAGMPAPARPTGCRAVMFALAAAALLQTGGAAADRLPEESEARQRGLAALPAILARVESPDADVRARARFLAKRIALDHYASSAPRGMRFVPGTVVVTSAGVRCSDGLYLGVHEVTLGEFREFARAHDLDDRWADGAADLPATNVSLEEARAFAESRGARLPTLEELARAAHGGGRLRYPWGERFEPARVNSREAGRGGPEPVGSRPGGVSVHGIADLLGNVAEWTETRADRRRYVVCGGSYRWYAEVSPPPYRLEASSRLPDVGFRLAKSAPPLTPGRE